jgi:hypothetical protein
MIWTHISDFNLVIVVEDFVESSHIPASIDGKLNPVEVLAMFVVTSGISNHMIVTVKPGIALIILKGWRITVDEVWTHDCCIGVDR